MFSKSKRQPAPKPSRHEPPRQESPGQEQAAAPTPSPPDTRTEEHIPSMSKSKPPASTLSADLTITGNIVTSGDIQVEGTVEGDIRAHLLTIGESATIKGEVTADDVVINGRIIGRVRGLKVRLTSTARVEGDIIHKTIAIESGAHFEGSVQRQDDPLSTGRSAPRQPQPEAARKDGGDKTPSAAAPGQGRQEQAPQGSS
ncbi:bactofilin family protein [Pontibaca methylaminivorans]|uniref:Protein CcmA, bactofilin family n=1 Tax=Pontibaca methylaminivorans TaxID=515897 RepID=A0A1R3WFU1_9RHOB|nr:polymer-forming cytoskeletal protein [Pontibaca methylaminivorans]SIT76989.1 protein CcmA, bactofilin family [Pontibaca methylaminivorans]